MKKSNLAVLVLSLVLTSVVSAGAGVIAPVPEGGATLGLLTVGVIAVVGLRHKLGK
jgi:hypothetical protein